MKKSLKTKYTNGVDKIHSKLMKAEEIIGIVITIIGIIAFLIIVAPVMK